MGYGVAQYTNNKAFVHISNCRQTSLTVGDLVEFDLEYNIAKNVKKIPNTPDRRPSPNSNTPGSAKL